MMNYWILVLSVLFTAAQAQAQNLDAAVKKWNAIVVCHAKLSRLATEMSVSFSNILNVNTTRTPEGGPYVAQRLVCLANDCQIEKIKTQPILAYEPDHPDADTNGYVAYPNIDLMKEMKITTSAMNDYEATIKTCFPN